jgi:hypothetical protein
MRFGRRTAKKLFVVRLIKDARQRFKRTAKAVFPVVFVDVAAHNISRALGIQLVLELEIKIIFMKCKNRFPL